MIVLAFTTLLALVLGLLLPKHWGVTGFVGATVFIFLFQVALNAGSGFAGSSIEDSLVFFNGSYASYIGFNLQITYRAFALPLIVLAIPIVFRLSRSSQPIQNASG